jgi:dCMP deaminase
MNRPSWDEYFMHLAIESSKRGTCPRKLVGSVIVKDNHILATGYNGSIAGLDHCVDVGCQIEDNHCVRTIHAEVNAIAQAARLGHSISNSVIYTNTYPCWNCFKTIVNAGITEIIYSELYKPDDKITEAINKLNYKIRQYC